MNYSKKIFPLFFALAFAACSSHKKLSSSKENKTVTKEEKNTTVINTTSSIKTKYSSLLNVNTDDISNISLYMLIDEWYGTAYKYGGCDKSGIDCSNFVNVLYQEIYKKSLKGSSASIFNQCRSISKNELQEGDLVFFKIENNTISHIGLYLQNNKFVHATTKKGVMIDDLGTAYYTKYFYKAGRLKQ